MTSLEDLRDIVREDPKLQPLEKETILRFAKSDDRATVYSAEGTIIRRLLKHPEFQVRHLHTESGAKVERREALTSEENAIVGVKGTVPVGVVKVRATARNTVKHSQIVSPGRGGDS